MSQINVTNIQHETGAGSNITLDASGNVVCAADVQMASQNGGPLAGFRNQLTGNFQVWQRGQGPTAVDATGRSYLADRWGVRNTTASGGTPTQQAFFAPNITLGYRYTAIGLTGNSYIAHTMEAQDSRYLAGKEITLSVYASHPVRGDISYYDASNAGVRISEVTMTPVPGESNRYSMTVTVPNVQIGRSLTEAGLEIVFYFNDQQSPLADGTYDLWYPQLEIGPVATPPEIRSIANELALCFRYYRSLPILWFNSSGLSAFNDAVQALWFMDIPMRATPRLDYSAEENVFNVNTLQTNTNCIRVSGNANQPSAIARLIDFTANAEF